MVKFCIIHLFRFLKNVSICVYFLAFLKSNNSLNSGFELPESYVFFFRYTTKFVASFHIFGSKMAIDILVSVCQ